MLLTAVPKSPSVPTMAKRAAPPTSCFVLGQVMSFDRTATKRRIVAVGLLTEQDLEALGPTFDRAWPVDETPCFGDLLLAIDEADRGLWRERDRIARHPGNKPIVSKV